MEKTFENIFWRKDTVHTIFSAICTKHFRTDERSDHCDQVYKILTDSIITPADLILTSDSSLVISDK